jgi:SAM-dependent methyltransferase
MRDVIEHIHNQDKFLQHLKNFLKPNGIVFFGFPPWRMPFGGHQQICKSKILSKMPYYHLFPRFLYRATLKIFGENKTTIDELLEIKETGIGINKFQKIVEKNGYQFVKKTFYLINPNYETKFGLKPRKQIGLIKIIPFFRDFLTTSVYCIIKSNHVQN